ncbi:DMT family transporter [Ancylobacter sp. MQZ15Z-1]|uniref:DMT family transporter n=1 Tax=Ancylobacter mangrovi TaxID=2972472 RepID=A0A9X2P9P3_9HYPH|nr:DMT family transporter [Ancylobacter mangrovi]MCS0493930.1 DMT family transporter [Ancylobacter mangrovi]
MYDPTANRRGILLMIAGSSVFSTNDAMSKLALAYIPPTEILAVRGAMAAVLMLLLIAWRGQLPAVRHVLDRRVLARASAEACVAVLFITAIVTMSIGDATAILQVAPLATMAVAVLAFGARIGAGQWAAVAVGFLGVMLIVKPGSSAFNAVALLPLASALLISARDFVTGRIGAHVPTLVVTLATALVGMAIGFGGSAVESWQPLNLWTIAYLFGGSLSLLCGHMLTIAAFRGADPSLISPYRYAAVVCSVGLSALMFNNMPDLISIGGMALIMAGGLYTMHQHRATPARKAVARPEASGEPAQQHGSR